MSRSTTGIPSSGASSMIVRRVIPGRAARVVGVTRTPSETMKRFVDVHSATAPRWSSMTASSSAARLACCFAMMASR